MDNLDGHATTECLNAWPAPPHSVIATDPLYRRFRSVQAAFRRRAQALMHDCDCPQLLHGSANVLLQLSEQDGLTLTELARRCEIENSSLTALVDDLERSGLAVRERSANDRRHIHMVLTQKGREVAPRIRHVWQQIQQIAFASISAQDIERMQSVMQTIESNLNGG